MNTLRELINFVGLPQGSLASARHQYSGQWTMGLHNVNLLVRRGAKPASMRNIIQVLQNLTPITLEAEIVGNRSGEEPFDPMIRVNPSGGITWFTTIEYNRNGNPFFHDVDNSGGDFRPTQLGPGSYQLTATRSGISNTGFVSLKQPLGTITVSAWQPPPRPQEPQHSLPEPPKIEVTFSGSIEHARFHVTGSGFLKNRPNNRNGVAIKVVDVYAAQGIGRETRHEFTGSSENGTIDHVVEGDLSGLTVNMNIRRATIAISATDGRPNQDDRTGFLWSEPVRIDFPV